MSEKNSKIKIVTKNRKAYFNYAIEDTYEAGIVLRGTEVKSIRNGKINLSDSYADFKNKELYLINCHISPYSHSYYDNHEPLRRRKLLMKRRELHRISTKVAERGYTLIPLKVYFKRGYVKVELGLARGKKAHDKRESIKQRDIERDIRANIKGRY